MKKLFFITLFTSLAYCSMAKKVKFAVDMTNEVISPNGIHITGDFQTAAGFPGGDWASNTTPLIQEGSSGIYSIVVDIPAFAKYEYKFVNGDQFYEAEFIPIESRVGYNFNDNRWLYVDSLANDTTFVGAIIFAGNAPSGLVLVRFVVNMQNESVSPNGVHVAGSFQGWNAENTILYSFGSNIYETIVYVTAGTLSYKYFNGNTSLDSEIVPAICSVNSNRELMVGGDLVLNEVCYASCTSCTVGFPDLAPTDGISVSPNPCVSSCQLIFNDKVSSHNILITDVVGHCLRTYSLQPSSTLDIYKNELKPGIYTIHVTSDLPTYFTTKLIIK